MIPPVSWPPRLTYLYLADRSRKNIWLKLFRENPTTGLIHTFEEQDMSEEVANENPSGHGKHKRRLGRRIRLTVGALTLVAVGAALGAGATAHAGRPADWWYHRD